MRFVRRDVRDLIAHQIAVTVLWTFDNALNDGRYTEVVRQAVGSLIGVRI
jgi:hypothetical protein